MQRRELDSEASAALELVLGYLNFSTGTPDPKCHAALNTVFAAILADEGSESGAWRECHQLLVGKLSDLRDSNPAFGDSRQAESALECVFVEVLPGYLEFHSNLLFHLDSSELFNSFFVGRACEIALRLAHSDTSREKWQGTAIKRLNDFVGYRPLPTLESHKHEAYVHEFVRPVPLYIRDAGVAAGRYQSVVETAIGILEATSEELLLTAHFDPSHLDELSYDPRAYDCEHPVNKRPNYHFGMWDPHQIDNSGFYRRFVVQQVTLNALMRRFEQRSDIAHNERLFEAGAVLAGTILMAAGISGGGPDTHSSDVTLTALLPTIAKYRDSFYERLIEQSEKKHLRRLSAEAKQLRQPFGGARQDLNSELARRRAAQLEHVHLARLYARMGFAKAATKQANIVPTASARMMCQIDCLITEGELSLEQGDLDRAAEIPQSVWQLLQQAIQCGAMIDPWNILGFDAQFSLFPGLESSVHDHRADELVGIIEQIFALLSRVWSEAAARDRDDLCAHIDSQFEELAKWWRQFAAHEVASVDSLDAQEAYLAAKHVAKSLQLWHRGGASAGDVKFWAPHADLFDSPKAYSLVIEALLERRDFVASQALLIHWLCQVGQVDLERGDSSFHELAEMWMVNLWHQVTKGDVELQQAWDWMSRFFDCLEANADYYWQVPDFHLSSFPKASPPKSTTDEEATATDEETAGDSLFDAAYTDMVYRDSTDDGVEGNIVDFDFQNQEELQAETDRLEAHLAFIATLSRLWRVAALFPHQGELDSGCCDRLERWIEQASSNQDQLQSLLHNVHLYRVVTPGADQQSMLEYDRKQIIRQTLVERIIINCVENANAIRLLTTTLCGNTTEVDDSAKTSCDDFDALDGELMSAVLSKDRERVRVLWGDYLDSLYKRPLLYVPVSRDGNPGKIVAARVTQHLIYDLLRWLPRLGLLVESFQLIEAAREMERDNPVGPGAVTEFDELFRIGYKSLVEALVDSSAHWTEAEQVRQEVVDEEDDEEDDGEGSVLVELLEKLTESLLIIWLAHSRTLRLSVMERANEEAFWNQIISFIKTYGDEIFTQHFLNVGNVRAILHQGVDSWLEMMEKDRAYESDFRLLDELDGKIARRDAVSILNLILEAVFENYSEYRDYNSTTTQSDRGDMLYTLLDFLRLRCRYDRICWNLKPVIQAHETLVRKGKHDSADLWRQALQEKISDEADLFLNQLAELQESYAMKMPTIADRLNERFVRPIAIDRICALVAPAVQLARQENDHSLFDQLEEEIAELTEEPSGVGLDVPTWLIALEEEVERVRSPEFALHAEDEYPVMESTPLSFSDATDQISRVGNNDRALLDDPELE